MDLKKKESGKEKREQLNNKESLAKIDEILSHVRSLDAQVAWTIRSQGKELKPLLLDYFSKRRRSAKVFLTVNGKRSSGEIAAYLDIHVQAVSNELSELEGRGLVELKSWGIYKKSKIDAILRISLALRKDPEFKNIR